MNTIKEGSIISFDYIGYTDAGEFEDGENLKITIGKEEFLPNFDFLLIGLKEGEVDIDYVYPTDYKVKYLASQPVTFHVRIKEIYE